MYDILAGIPSFNSQDTIGFVAARQSSLPGSSKGSSITFKKESAFA